MVCQWCGVNHSEGILNHICADGSTFEERVKHYTAGDKPPANLMRRISDQLKNGTAISKFGFDSSVKPKDKYDVLPLTPEDIDWLIGLKIGW